MAIGRPQSRLLRNVPLRSVTDRLGDGSRKKVDVSISLVPFIDFLLVLVVFLLCSFGNDVLPFQQDRAMTLPEGEHTEALGEAPVVTIGATDVLLDGRRRALVSDLAADADVSPIEALQGDLETVRQNWILTHPGEDFPGTVIIAADRSTDYRVLRKVMITAAQAGYPNASFAVNEAG